jgi:deazaflavin-dependent oxidoreductase (nitroreductase family)
MTPNSDLPDTTTIVAVATRERAASNGRATASTTPAQFNAQVINEFRANDGRVGGMLEGTPLLLLHHTGPKSGVSRVNPLGYLRDDGRYAIFASNGGAPRHPDWVRNLRAQPNARIEVGSETLDVVAEEVTGEERERLSRSEPSASRSSANTRGRPIASSR